MSILDKFRLDGKVAVITGAGRGIGAACAKAFAERLTTRTHAPRTKTTSAFGMGLSSSTFVPTFSDASLSETGAPLET